MIGVALGWVLLPEVYNKIVQGLDTPVHILCVPLCASVCLCVSVCEILQFSSFSAHVAKIGDCFLI